MAWRTAGKLGCGGGPWILFFPPHFFEATLLKEGEGDHCHECMTVKALPGSPFEVVKAKFLLQLLMGLLANPSCLDGGSQGAQIGRSRQIGEIVAQKGGLLHRFPCIGGIGRRKRVKSLFLLKLCASDGTLDLF
jgi:hypothetical protein